jgi:hypothetical protein
MICFTISSGHTRFNYKYVQLDLFLAIDRS